MKRAETIADVGVLPLSRRDRAAMEFAMELLREMVADRPGSWSLAAEKSLDLARKALSASWASGDVADEIAHAVPTIHDWYTYSEPPRLLRARLALALRVLLRVDLGDYGGRIVCPDCHSSLPSHYRVGTRAYCDATNREVRAIKQPVRPLWQDAPPHDGRSAKQRRAQEG